MTNYRNIIVGTAQTDPSYGFIRNNNAQSLIKIIKDKNLGIDTDPTYKNSKDFFLKIVKINSRIISKLPAIYCELSLFKKKLDAQIKKIFDIIGNNKLHTILIKDPLLVLDRKKWSITIKILKQLKKSGTIKKIGVSVYNTKELDKILEVFTPDVVQFPLNIFNQSFLKKNYLKDLKKKNIELHARSIFLQGLLLQKKNKLPKYFWNWSSFFEKWYDHLRTNKVSAYKLCLTWALSQKYVDKYILGFDNKKQINEFLKININKKNKINKFINTDENLIDPRFWPHNKNINLGDAHKKWIEATNIIPSGNMLLSKKPNRFLKGGWPTYFSKAKGCFIWNLHNKKYLDFCLMGIGTNILGYADPTVNSSVKKIIDKSNVSTLNSFDEFLLSKKLLKLHPWAEMCFFSKTGAEANAIAIRIARTYIKKNKIAVCGYHGWQDWYLSSNLINKDNLNKLHLSGLGSEGIPNELAGLTLPFRYNDINSFKNLIKMNPDIGIVFMEVQRNEKPKNNFLQKIRKITIQKNIILIFDECTSGFREVLGGLHLKYNIIPDLCIFGKAIANGVPITAIIGKRDVMNSANSTFISSTFWTDRMGFAAAIATIDQMKKKRSWSLIKRLGIKIKNNWKKISKKHNFPIKISGIDSMPTFEFVSNKNEYYKTYLTQEMLKLNILATNTVYVSIMHKEYTDKYLKHLDKIFYQLKKIDIEGSILKFLNHPLSDLGFKRLN